MDLHKNIQINKTGSYSPKNLFSSNRLNKKTGRCFSDSFRRKELIITQSNMNTLNTQKFRFFNARYLSRATYQRLKRNIN